MEIKITRKLLDDYRKLKQEIPFLEMELREMKKGDNGFSNSTIFDYQKGYPRPQSVVGFDWPLYEKRQQTLARKKEKVKGVEAWISSIEDVKARCIFKMFYINGMTWEKIAIQTGYPGNPDYPRIMIRDRYLKEKNIL